jgi:hypothetical protein
VSARARELTSGLLSASVTAPKALMRYLGTERPETSEYERMYDMYAEPCIVECVYAEPCIVECVYAEPCIVENITETGRHHR